ncbi:MAG: ATP-binding cassette domain-containing protein [Coprothermobacterota bacterium]|nr:ATP-binding cassette domain-containing protein [Coprothermobacterota bacterium]
MIQSIVFRDVAFTYERMSGWLFEGLSLHFATGWTGIIGANGAGKTTLLRLAAGELTPMKGIVEIAVPAVYCQQRTDLPPGGLDGLLRENDAEALKIRGNLGVEEDWPERWEPLSHGERKRAQIAAALWQKPDLLAIDEPTNHLDRAAREMLQRALRGFRGIGLLISHDRELLDSLCSQCVFLDPPSVIIRPGGYTAATEQVACERASAQREREAAKTELMRLRRVATKRRAIAQQSDSRVSKRGLNPKDSDAREKIDMARVTGKDAVGGKLLRQLDGRLHQAEERLQGIQAVKTNQLGIWAPGERSRRDWLFSLKAGELALGERRRLVYPDLAMRPDQRIALTGPNGGGKSTLIGQVVAAVNVPAERLVYIPQEFDRESCRDLLERVRQLSHEEMGRLLAIVSRLGSRPSRLLESEDPSPGEVRKLLLALGIVKAPHLIIMDEPTNHMDLPSIECLEDALRDCPCGLLLVSHDLRFLKALVKSRWDIEEKSNGQFSLCLSEF